MAKYRKRSVIVDACQWNPKATAGAPVAAIPQKISELMLEHPDRYDAEAGTLEFHNPAFTGRYSRKNDEPRTDKDGQDEFVYANPGDYIVWGDGDPRPMKEDQFLDTYELV